MALRHERFSDLLLFKEAQGKAVALMKSGCVERELCPMPTQYDYEVQALYVELQERLVKTNTDTCRFCWDTVWYRAAFMTDMDRGAIFFLRRIVDTVPDLKDLGTGADTHGASIHGSGNFALVCRQLLAKEHSHGLVLISGAQGSGKTTVASALVKERLVRHGGHAVTFENPPEYPLARTAGISCFQSSIRSEKELGQHIERAHRYAAPNILFIGEIRTKYAATEATRIALGSKEQLVVATIHGTDILAALQRLCTWVRESDGDNGLDTIATTLLALVHVSLHAHDGVLYTQVPEFLLLSHAEKARQDVHPVRAKIRADKLHTLLDDIHAQAARLASKGGEYL